MQLQSQQICLAKLANRVGHGLTGQHSLPSLCLDSGRNPQCYTYQVQDMSVQDKGVQHSLLSIVGAAVSISSILLSFEYTSTSSEPHCTEPDYVQHACRCALSKWLLAGKHASGVHASHAWTDCEIMPMVQGCHWKCY